MTAPLSWPADDRGGSLGDGRPASATHHPDSLPALQDMVREAGASGLAVYPQGGSTALDHGGIPGRPGVAIRLGGLNRVIDYPAADMTITVEAGITLGAVRDLVARHNQRLALEAAFPGQATLGGIYATAATGPRRFGWGRPRDQIIGVAFVAGSGDLIRGGGRVVKNVAGYDFPKLLTGSMGTLGIITELTLKVSPRPGASAQVAVAFDSLPLAASALEQLNISGTRPVALELVDAATMGTGQEGSWTLLVGFEGNQAAVDWQVDRLGSELRRTDLRVRHDVDAEAAWLDLVELEASANGPLGFSASFAPSRALDFIGRVDLECWSVRAHVGNGVVRCLARGEVDLESATVEVEQLRTDATRLDGSLVLSRCPTAWKGHLLVWGNPRPDWAIAERVKHALDPARVLNPGRFVGTI